MTFLAPHKQKADELTLILSGWENRWELRQLTRTLPRSLIAAAILSLIVGAAGYWRFGLRAEQLLLISLCASGAAVLLNLLMTLIFPRSLAQRARHFDLEFNLCERLSTALELMSGRLRTHPEIEARQIADALFHARQIKAKRSIELDFRFRELTLLLILWLALALLIALPLLSGGYPIQDTTSPAVEAAQEDIREIIETVAKDSDLTDVDRRDLLESLEIALERLEMEDISEEEAFAAMSQLQAELDETRQQLENTMELDQMTMEAALEALEDFIPPSDPGDAMDAETTFDDLESALQDMAETAETMDAEQASAMAEALQEAGESLGQMNEELSESMQNMSAALNEAAMDELQQQLDEALRQIEREQAQQEESQDAAMMLQEQSQQAQEAAEEIARQQAQQQMFQSPAESGEESDSGERRAGNQQSQDAADEAQSGNQSGNMRTTRNMPGDAQNQALNRDSRSAGAGAGEGESDNRSLAGAAGEDQGADTNNRTTGARQIEYEALYSPNAISGGGAEEIRLRTDASDQSFGEGDFDENPLGEARVSYDTVFSDYQNAANRALESDYVPLGLRDVVRDYFTSLQPQS